MQMEIVVFRDVSVRVRLDGRRGMLQVSVLNVAVYQSEIIDVLDVRVSELRQGRIEPPVTRVQDVIELGLIARLAKLSRLETFLGRESRPLDVRDQPDRKLQVDDGTKHATELDLVAHPVPGDHDHVHEDQGPAQDWDIFEFLLGKVAAPTQHALPRSQRVDQVEVGITQVVRDDEGALVRGHVVPRHGDLCLMRAVAIGQRQRGPPQNKPTRDRKEKHSQDPLHEAPQGAGDEGTHVVTHAVREGPDYGGGGQTETRSDERGRGRAAPEHSAHRVENPLEGRHRPPTSTAHGGPTGR